MDWEYEHVCRGHFCQWCKRRWRHIESVVCFADRCEACPLCLASIGGGPKREARHVAEREGGSE